MKRPQAERQQKGSVIRTLIVDDSEAVRTSLVAFMAWVPRVKVVGTAGDGVHALELMAVRHPDLMLMDMNMPVLDGLEATRLIRRRRFTTRVVLMDIYDVEEIEARCLQAGADAFLSKANVCDRLETLIARLFPVKE
jgi:DNA-binding NarL/FixJ family response regulator